MALADRDWRLQLAEKKRRGYSKRRKPDMLPSWHSYSKSVPRTRTHGKTNATESKFHWTLPKRRGTTGQAGSVLALMVLFLMVLFFWFMMVVVFGPKSKIDNESRPNNGCGFIPDVLVRRVLEAGRHMQPPIDPDVVEMFGGHDIVSQFFTRPTEHQVNVVKKEESKKSIVRIEKKHPPKGGFMGGYS
jgi:hypothetical protein